LDATYFVARQGLYKVRFGNFPTKEQARARAEEIRKSGIIEEFYVVSPEDYAVAHREARGRPTSGRNWSGPPGAFLAFPTFGGASPPKPASIAAPGDDRLSVEWFGSPPDVGEQFVTEPLWNAPLWRR